jgi:hypothetical protein
MRDINGIAAKLQTVLTAGQANTDTALTLQEWDMWGPLFFSLLLAVYAFIGIYSQSRSLSIRVTRESPYVFELCFLLIWGGAAIVYANARLLGHQASLMHTICYLGYSVFPLAAVAVVKLVMPFAILNSLFCIFATIWSISGTNGKEIHLTHP